MLYWIVMASLILILTAQVPSIVAYWRMAREDREWRADVLLTLVAWSISWIIVFGSMLTSLLATILRAKG